MSVTLHDNGDGATTPHMTGEVVDYYVTSFTFRAGVQANDVVYFVYISQAGATTTVPSGWTQVYAGNVGNVTPPAGANPFRVEVWQKICAGTEGLTTVTWQGTGSTVRSGYAVMRGVTTAYHIETQGSSYVGGFNELWGFGARADGDAFLGFFWDDIPGGPGTFTYPPESTGAISMGWYRIHSQTASVPGGYNGTSDNPNTYPDYSDPTVGITLTALAPNVGAAAGTSTVAATGIAKKPAVGASAGTSTVTGVGKANTAGVGAAAGTASAAGTGNNAASKGTGAGTSTATGVGSASIGSAGSAQGAATVTGVTGLRQAVGLAEGTSAVVYNDPQPILAPVSSRVDHVQRAIDRLCQYAKEKRSVQ